MSEEPTSDVRRYHTLVERIFFDHWSEGVTDFVFVRDEIVKKAKLLSIELPKNVGDVPATLEEIGRVLRPGGRLLFLEHVRSDEPRVARRQDRLHGPWAWFARGCRCNQHTVELLEASPLAVERLERATLPAAPSIVRPIVLGSAVRG